MILCLAAASAGKPGMESGEESDGPVFMACRLMTWTTRGRRCGTPNQTISRHAILTLSRHAVQTNDPDYTRRKVREFLATHTVYELIPESGKVVLLDCALPIRQAFHALHEQASRPAPCNCGLARPLHGSETGTAWQGLRVPAARPTVQTE